MSKIRERAYNRAEIESVNGFGINISYLKVDENPSMNHIGTHIHEECEIYFNMSGDVSCIVEGNIYPVKKGSLIITRPFEYHHCVYHSKALHEFFCIWFPVNGNEKLLSLFTDRNAGEGNIIVLDEKNAQSFSENCFALLDKNISAFEKNYRFFKMIHLLGKGIEDEEISRNMPDDIEKALKFIERSYLEKITVKDIAAESHVSINTLERHFREYLRVTPLAYIAKKRIFHAAMLLNQGMGVSEACEKSGFTDYSGFIAKFRKTFGITPLQYKKKSKS